MRGVSAVALDYDAGSNDRPAERRTSRWNPRSNKCPQRRALKAVNGCHNLVSTIMKRPTENDEFNQ